MNKPFTTDHLKWLWAAFKRNIPKKLSEFKNDLKVSDLEHDIHPDHSVNEPTDPSYIQNRTHYKEMVKRVLLEETYYDHNTSSYGPYFPTGLKLGDQIIVKWNGIEYPCVVEKDPIIEGLCFGNKRNYHSSYDDTGEPFLIEQDGENGWIHIEPFVYPYDSVTFEIFSIEEHYFVLDEKFIPDSIARTNNIEKGFVKKDQYATLDEAGIVSVSDEFGTGIVKGCVTTKPATTEEIYNKQQYYKPITPSFLDHAIKAGLCNNSLMWLKKEQAKARKTIGVEEPDWNETDDTSFGHIKNKPFYEIENEEILFTSKEIVLTGGTYGFNPSLPLEYGDVCTVIIDTIPLTVEFGKELVLIGTEYESTIGAILMLNEEGLTIIQAMKTRFYLEIKRVEKVVGKQLDEKFIPDSIARTKDLVNNKTFVATITESDTGEITCDKTYSEILEAYEKGNRIIGKLVYPNHTSMLEFVMVSVAMVEFLRYDRNDNSFMSYSTYAYDASWYKDTHITIGEKYRLNTTDKTIVGAINEVKKAVPTVTDILNALPTWNGGAY